jgi:hypothetical protein
MSIQNPDNIHNSDNTTANNNNTSENSISRSSSIYGGHPCCCCELCQPFFETSGNSASSSSSSTPGGRPCICELCQPFFGTTDATGKPLDFTRSLASGHPLVIAYKLMMVGVLLATFVHGLATYPHKPCVFRLSYLTIWSLIWAIIYSLSSLYLSISTALFRKQQQPQEEQQQQPPCWLTYWTWVWYSIAVNNAIIVTGLYWGIEYERNLYPVLDFNSYTDHGGSGILLLIEGLLINRVPIRIKHYFAVLLFAILYVVWTAIHDIVLTVNPQSGDDKPLFPLLPWEEDVIGAVTVILMVLFVLIPLLHVFVWVLSTLGRRYVTSSSSASSWSSLPPVAGSQARGAAGETDEEAPTTYAVTH